MMSGRKEEKQVDDGGGLGGEGGCSSPGLTFDLMEEAEAETSIHLLLRWRSDRYMLTAQTVEDWTIRYQNVSFLSLSISVSVSVFFQRPLCSAPGLPTPTSP